MNNLGQHITIANIRSALKENLPGLDAQIKMLPKGRSLSMSTDENVKESAVLILFFSENNTLYFCLTKRHSGLKHHPGQISFPGGKCEKHEKNPYDTALRETEEEIGVEANTIELLGKLTDVYISVSNFNIHPYIGYVEEKPNFIINKYEVEELLIFPLHSIFDSNNYSTELLKTKIGEVNVPCYRINENVIWGATSMMIAELEALLKQYYSHRAKH